MRVQSQSLFRPNAELLFIADSAIVQLDTNTTQQLLVCTMTRTLLYDLIKYVATMLIKTLNCSFTYRVVGRSGRTPSVHGACFLGAGADASETFVCARPNGRLWECGVRDAQVHNTHKFNNVDPTASNWPHLPVLSFEYADTFANALFIAF